MQDYVDEARERAEYAFTLAEAAFSCDEESRSDSNFPQWWVAGADYVRTVMEARTMEKLRISGASYLRGIWDLQIQRESNRVFANLIYPYERAISDHEALNARLSKFCAYVDLRIRPKLAALLAAHLSSPSGTAVSPSNHFEENPQSPSSSPEYCDQELERRQRLLREYKAATGIVSDAAIYQAKGTVYKAEFYKWRNGSLAANSKTARRLEEFLAEKKLPIPRIPRSR